MKPDCILIIGAGGAIAQAIIAEQLKRSPPCKIVAISRHTDKETYDSALSNSQTVCITCSYSEQSIKKTAETLMNNGYKFDQIFICNGVLHGDGYYPEKQLADFDRDSFISVLNANTITPMLWLMQLSKFTGDGAVITVFSARVGSISDNRLGGWYSYRASKAALNMLVKSAAIELTRRHKSWRFLLFHPGTTDTNLSKPFQKNVPKEKLFAPSFVAEQLFSILQNLPENSAIQYLDWQGKTIDW